MATMTRKQQAAPPPVEQVYADSLDKGLEDILALGIRPRDEYAASYGKELLGTFVEGLMAKTGTTPASSTLALKQMIAEIDRLITDQLNAVMHAEPFKTLESSWRGLHQFVQTAETGENMKIKVLNCSKKELLHDFRTATEFTESTLWKTVYSYSFGLYGGDPYALLVGDYEFGKHPEDVELLGHIAEVAAAAHSPFLASTSPGMFGLESFAELTEPRDLGTLFGRSNPENAQWLSFRESENSRFVGLCLPHVLMRLPYGQATRPVEAFAFEEDVEGSHENYLWGNAAYSFAGRVAAAFAKHHWCSSIRGPQGGGQVSGLPVHTFKTREGRVGAKCPTEVLIPDDRDNELSKLGFIPLVNYANSDHAAFFSAESTHQPRVYDSAEATASERLSSKLEYLLVTSRMAHYLKAICRDRIGGFMSRQNCEDELNRWVSQYVLLHDDGTEEAKAAQPLREARVEVTEDKARPGCYRAVMAVRPHFHLDEIKVALRLVAELPQPTK